MTEVHYPEHGYAYLSDGDGDVRELDGVEEVEFHRDWGEACVTFEDGTLDYYETDFVEVE